MQLSIRGRVGHTGDAVFRVDDEHQRPFRTFAAGGNTMLCRHFATATSCDSSRSLPPSAAAPESPVDVRKGQNDRSVLHSSWLLAACVVGLASSYAIGEPVIWNGNGHGYEVIVTAAPICWTEANTDATNRGGELATITSAAEQQFVESLLTIVDPPTGTVWIGLTEQTEGIYVWVSGEPFGFANWFPGEPNNAAGGEYRGSILWSQGLPNNGRSGAWNDMSDCSPYGDGLDYGYAHAHVVEY